MQDFKVKFLDLPDDLFDVITAVKSGEEPSFDKNEASDYNEISYLKSFERQIDPVIICLFYGLYKSKKLPENVTESIRFGNNHEFGANITKHIEAFVNLLYALWIKENDIPEKASDLLKYREKLYSFLSTIQDYNYIVSTIFPYYLSAADEKDGDRSFINRLKHSGYCRYENSDVSPEYVSLIFIQEQEDFMNYIKINEIVQKVEINAINLERDEKAEKIKNEIQNIIENRIDDLEKNLRIFLHKKISKEYPNYWDNIEKCIDLKNRAEDRILEHLKNNPSEIRENLNPFEFMSFFDYKKIIVREFWPIFNSVFRSKSDLESNIEHISEVRNVLKHNRNLTELETKKAEFALTWFESILEQDKK